MLDEVKCWCAEIARLAEHLLREQNEVLTAEQSAKLRLIYVIATEYQPCHFSFLEELLQENTPFEAVSRMSTEWRTPLTTIRGYCELLLLDLFGPLSIEQRNSIEQIKTCADALWNWCSIGSPFSSNNE